MIQKQPLSLVHEILEPRTPQAHPPLIVLLHGYGSHEGDLFSFADSLNKHALIVSVRAPIRLPWGGFAWYNIQFDNSPKRWADPDEAKAALTQLDAFIDEVTEAYQTQKGNCTILGFSQGAILSYAYSLLHPEKIKHVLALSGYIFQDIMPATIPITAQQKLEYFVMHGTEDPVIPIDWARKSVAALEGMQLRHTYREYPMPHGISPQAFQDLLLWMRQRQLA
jgi:phospholipase/carboxylesterase